MTNVADRNALISKTYDLDHDKCVIAGLLHDISAIIKPEDMLKYAYENCLDVCEAERNHRDPNPSNIIVSQDEWGFIDFELSEKNLRIYDPCYAAVAILSESFDEKDQAKLSKWLEIYRNILWGYDSVVKLTNEECAALPYVVMADQLVSTACFSEQDKYTELFMINKRMTQWLITIFDKLKIN